MYIVHSVHEEATQFFPWTCICAVCCEQRLTPSSVLYITLVLRSEQFKYAVTTRNSNQFTHKYGLFFIGYAWIGMLLHSTEAYWWKNVSSAVAGWAFSGCFLIWSRPVWLVLSTDKLVMAWCYSERKCCFFLACSCYWLGHYAYHCIWLLWPPSYVLVSRLS